MGSTPFCSYRPQTLPARATVRIRTSTLCFSVNPFTDAWWLHLWLSWQSPSVHGTWSRALDPCSLALMSMVTGHDKKMPTVWGLPAHWAISFLVPGGAAGQ